jgi:hypothetical protein
MMLGVGELSGMETRPTRRGEVQCVGYGNPTYKER